MWSIQIDCSLLLTTDCVELCAISLTSKVTPIWREWKLLLPLRENKQSFQILFFPQWATTPSGPVDAARSHSRHSRIRRSLLDEWSSRRRDLCLTRYNSHKRQIPMPPAGFELLILASFMPQTHALDCTSTGISRFYIHCLLFISLVFHYRNNFNLHRT